MFSHQVYSVIIVAVTVFDESYPLHKETIWVFAGVDSEPHFVQTVGQAQRENCKSSSVFSLDIETLRNSKLPALIGQLKGRFEIFFFKIFTMTYRAARFWRSTWFGKRWPPKSWRRCSSCFAKELDESRREWAAGMNSWENSLKAESLCILTYASLIRSRIFIPQLMFVTLLDTSRMRLR